MARKIIPCVAAGALLTSFASGLRAQRYALGVSADVTGSVDAPVLVGFGTPSPTNEIGTSIGSYPTVSFTGHGERYSFQTSYSLGVSRSLNNTGSSTNSHAANISFATQLGPKWNMSLSDGYEETRNSSTFRLLRGDTSVTNPDEMSVAAPPDFNFVFDPILVDSRQTNYAGIGFNRKLTERSSLVFGATQSFLTYRNRAEVANSISDERRSAVNAGYSRSIYRGNWTVSYNGSQSKFSRQPTSQTHAAIFGFNRQISQTMALNLSGGPAYVVSPESGNGYIGANASIGVHRSIKNGGFSATIATAAGESSGIGTVSQNQTATLGMSHSFGRFVSTSLDFSAYNTRDHNTKNTTLGFSGGGTIGFLIARRWYANVGAQYQHYETYSRFNQDQKRVFVSMRFHEPVLWRF